MEPVGQYIWTVCIAALVCCVVRHLTGGAKLPKMITAIFLALTVLRPLGDFRLADFQLPDDSADALVAQGQETYQKELARCISERVEAYILDKGEKLGVTLSCQVELSEDAIPKPVRVRLSGAVSPYVKGRLQQILADDLGIAKEDQIWT